MPLVIAAHGCGGMFSAHPRRRDQLSERAIAWTEVLLADGYAVLWPDSFNSARPALGVRDQARRASIIAR